MTTTDAEQQYDTEAIRRGLETEGIIALKGAFPVEWVDRLREDLEKRTWHWDNQLRPGLDTSHGVFNSERGEAHRYVSDAEDGVEPLN